MFFSKSKKKTRSVSSIIEDFTRSIDELNRTHAANKEKAEFHEAESMRHDEEASACHGEAEWALKVAENLKKLTVTD